MFGCATGQWVTLKNGLHADASEIRIDSLSCEREAATTYPFAQVITSTGGGSSGSSSTTCTGLGGLVNCNTSGGGYSSPKVRTSDGNAGRRADYYKSCMAILGYQRVFVSDSAASTDQPLTNTGPEKYTVKAGGHCNESDDCVSGLECGNRKCGKPTASLRSTKTLIGPGAFCGSRDSCRSGLICSGNKCVIDFGKDR